MNLERTHYCGRIDETILGQRVVLTGWVNVRRDHGGVIFVDLRDRKGTVQIVFDSEYNISTHHSAEKLRGEYVIYVEGHVRERDKENVNPNLNNGTVEVVVDAMEILNACEALPFQINENKDISERLRLTYRYLDLRRPEMMSNMVVRSKVTKIVRDYLYDREFHEIETPILTKSTPEGARDYLVPSRIQRGKFFALPQSPQLFKQILMVGGLDRYFQIVKCFRDEDLRGNRQPEFTQIDLEMSFPSKKNIMNLCDGMISSIFKEILGVDVALPIPVMSYSDAMNLYGSDAPDLRYDLKLDDITELAGQTQFKVFLNAVETKGIVKMLRVPNGASFSRKELENLTELAKVYHAKGLAWVKLTDDGWQSPIAKFIDDDIKEKITASCNGEKGDLLLFAADKPKIVFDALGNVRKEIARLQKLIPDNVFNFVWIVDFPLFLYDEESKKINSSHHPFTAPNPDDFLHYAETEPLKINSQAYDLVLNGVELGGGSIRIHNSDMQRHVFRLLGLSPEDIHDKFGFLITAMKYGAPPHGGIAFGLDRLLMFLCHTDSIRDVIAFPKTQQASCLMTEAPTDVPSAQLKNLGIARRSD